MTGIAPWVLGAFVSLAGLLGLVAASHARDPGFYLFGLALFAFAVLFVFGLIRRNYDERKRATVEANEKPGDVPSEQIVPAASAKRKAAS